MHSKLTGIPKLAGANTSISRSVDFWVVAFKIDFGATNKIPDPLDLKEFWEMLHQPGPNEATVEKNDANPVQSFLSFHQEGQKDPTLSTESGAGLKFVLENSNFPKSQTNNASPTADSTSTGVGTKVYTPPSSNYNSFFDLQLSVVCQGRDFSIPHHIRLCS
jgi:hypothetical protein